MRVAIAGVGHWHGAMHLDAVRAAGAEVSAVWDPDPATTAAFAATHAAPAAPSLDALLATNPGLVVVMGHPADCPATARAVLATGLPMVLEKPAAPDTETLAALAPGPDRFVAVPFANRASPIWAELARLRAERRLGRLAHASFRLINGAPERYRVDRVGWMLDPAIAGGGALRNLGLHGADAALHLLGDAPWTLASSAVRDATHAEAVDDYALAILSVPAGPVVTIETGYTFATMQPGGDFEWRIVTANATLIDRGHSFHVATLDDGARRDLPPVPSNQRYRAFMADTLASLHAGRPPEVDFAAYIAAMRLVDQIYATSR